MQLGMIGLGRMGANIVRRLMRDGHTCVVYDVSPDASRRSSPKEQTGSDSLDDFVAKLDVPRRAWIMVPAGEITESTVDGARVAPRAPATRSSTAATPTTATTSAARPSSPSRGIRYVDCGTSGGVFGLERGFCLMVGGPDDAFAELEPIFASLAPGVEAAERTPGRDGEPAPEERGYLHCGPAGAGHFVKMVHNGIEYGMMAALAEGLNILHGADAGLRQRDKDAETAPLDHPEFYSYALDIPAITEVWRRGSVVESWLLDLTAAALQESPGARRLRRPRLRLGRGALDGDRRDRGGRAGRRADRRPLLAVLLPRRGAVREQGAVGDAQAVRRASREARLVGRRLRRARSRNAWPASLIGRELAEVGRGERLPRSLEVGRVDEHLPRAAHVRDAVPDARADVRDPVPAADALGPQERARRRRRRPRSARS